MFPLLQHLDRGALQHIQRRVAEFGRVFAVVFQKCRNSSPIRDIESDGVSARNVRGLSVPISYPVRGICGTAFQFCLTKQLLCQNMLSVIACIVVLSFFFSHSHASSSLSVKIYMYISHFAVVFFFFFAFTQMLEGEVEMDNCRTCFKFCVVLKEHIVT